MLVCAKHQIRFLRHAARAVATASRQKVEGVTLVTDTASADKALSVLRSLSADAVVGWDTETTGVDIKLGLAQSSSAGVVCATAFGGDDIDFGNGPRLLIDNVGPEAGVLEKFRDYFADSKSKKVFHNYTFDRHMLKREGCEVQGLEADTLILARIHDTAKSNWEGHERAKMKKAQEETVQAYERSQFARSFAVTGINFGGQKVDVKVFGAGLHTVALPVLEDTKGSFPRLPGIGYDLKSLATSLELVAKDEQLEQFPFGAKADAALQAFNSPETFQQFVEYATRDAVLTWKLFQCLKLRLMERPWSTEVHKPSIQRLLCDSSLSDTVADELRSYRTKTATFSFTKKMQASDARGSLAGTPGTVQLRTGQNMWDFYQQNLQELPECLANMQERGTAIDTAALERLAEEAAADLAEKQELLRETLKSVRKPDGTPFNEDLSALNISSHPQLQTLLFGGVTNKNNRAEILEETRTFPGAKGARKFAVRSLGLEPGNKRADFTPHGWPSTNRDALARLRASEGAKLLLENAVFDQESIAGVEASLDLLAECRQIKTNIQQMKTLQAAAVQGRVHPSWQFMTSTGRLTCSKPNLHSLVAGKRDIYGLRSAFKAKPGCKLVLADYSQLELRILAHISKCRVMLEGLHEGNDFHAQVAADLFPHVREAVEKGEVSTICGGSNSVKSVFPEERNKAKQVNFGIIYGMTAASLAEDLDVSTEEAERMFKAWYDAKPAVRSWKQHVEMYAEREQVALSLLGRERHLPLLDGQASPFYRQKAKRAAVNYVIQGSAADLVTAVMLQLERSPDLKEIGFYMIMQVHDEIILEGPAEHAEKAAELLQATMKAPFKDISASFEFSTPLEVNLVIGDTLQAKA